MNQALIGLALQEAPAVISGLKALFSKQNPTATVPSDEQVIAAYKAAFTSSLEKDEAWLKAHPVAPAETPAEG